MNIVDFPLDGTAQTYPQPEGLPAFDPATLSIQATDAHLLVQDGAQTLARASLWWREVPGLPNERLGIVGHFAAAGAQPAALLLAALKERLRRQGCTAAVGPMDGNTWRRYRFVTDAGSEPPFFLEPGNPPLYPRWFEQAGFNPLAEYSSALVTDLTARDPRIPRAMERLTTTGVHWRPLDPARFEQELKAIFRLSVLSFRRNFLYTPISEAAFLAQYRAIAPHVRPELTLLAEQGEELLGYLFGIPDLEQARRGEAVDSFIVKTVAVLPGRRAAGLGGVLVAEAQRIAHELGYRRAIHALMHASNPSLNLSAHYARVMRRYTLYRAPLGVGS